MRLSVTLYWQPSVVAAEDHMISHVVRVPLYDELLPTGHGAKNRTGALLYNVCRCKSPGLTTIGMAFKPCSNQFKGITKYIPHPILYNPQVWISNTLLMCR